MAWSFLWFFFLLLAYYIVRPVRETLGLVGGVRNLKWLFLATALVMLAAVPIYSALVARFPRRVLVPIVYRFFALNLVAFWVALAANPGQTPEWLAATFFVWVTVFGLFVVSIFWSFLADVFTREQGKRLFGIIAAGGSVGAIVGSIVTSTLVKDVGVAYLLLLSAALLEAALWCRRRLGRVVRRLPEQPSALRASDDDATGGGIFSGFTNVVRSPYLLGIAGYVFLTSFCGTTIYFQQAEIVEAELATDAARTRFFANVNLGTQVLTLTFQVLLAQQLMRKAGLAFTLCILPAVYLGSFVALGTWSTLGVLAVVKILTRASAYGLAGPANNVLFTVVAREDKYKAKSFIDTVVFRTGDSVTGQIFDGLRSLRFGLVAISWLLVPVGALWLLLAWRLGRSQAIRDFSPESIPGVAPPSEE